MVSVDEVAGVAVFAEDSLSADEEFSVFASVAFSSAGVTALVASEPATDSGFGVAERLEDSSSPMVKAASNSVGSGPRTGVPVLRRGRLARRDGDRLREGRRAELERASDSWADF
jgi:hypothetical protein